MAQNGKYDKYFQFCSNLRGIISTILIPLNCLNFFIWTFEMVFDYLALKKTQFFVSEMEKILLSTIKYPINDQKIVKNSSIRMKLTIFNSKIIKKRIVS